MGLLDSIGNAAQRTKLTAEVTLVDREIAARKRDFGVEFYDVIASQSTSHPAGSPLSSPSSKKKVFSAFHTIQKEVQQPLDDCAMEVKGWELEVRQKEDEAMIIDAKRENDFSSQRSVGKRVSETAKEAQLATQIKLLQRQIKQRKEQFGARVWDVVVPLVTNENDTHRTASTSSTTAASSQEGSNATAKKKPGWKAMSGLGKSVKKVTKTLGKVSGVEQDMEACIIKAKNDVRSMEETKRRKLNLIEGLKR